MEIEIERGKLWCVFVLEPLSLSLVCDCFSKKKKKEAMRERERERERDRKRWRAHEERSRERGVMKWREDEADGELCINSTKLTVNSNQNPDPYNVWKPDLHRKPKTTHSW